jgi:hypothetical protein
MSKYFFRDSGFEAEALSANITGNGVILNAPSNNDSIYILGISCHSNTILKQDNNSGEIVMNIGAGNYNLPATVKVGNGKALYVSSSSPVSVIYHTN